MGVLVTFERSALDDDVNPAPEVYYADESAQVKLCHGTSKQADQLAIGDVLCWNGSMRKASNVQVGV